MRNAGRKTRKEGIARCCGGRRIIRHCHDERKNSASGYLGGSASAVDVVARKENAAAWACRRLGHDGRKGKWLCASWKFRMNAGHSSYLPVVGRASQVALRFPARRAPEGVSLVNRCWDRSR
jgi:hypothetical protein